MCSMRKSGVWTGETAPRELRDALTVCGGEKEPLRIAATAAKWTSRRSRRASIDLARRLNYAGEDAGAAVQFRADVARYTARVRDLFDQVVGSRAASKDDGV